MADATGPSDAPSSTTGAQIGDGTRIWHWVHVCGGARIGRNCSLGQNVFVGNQVVIGDNVKIQNNVSVYDDVTLEDDVFCGPSMVFTNVVQPAQRTSRARASTGDTLVRRGATLGRQLHHRLRRDDRRIRLHRRRRGRQSRCAGLCPHGGRAGPADRLDEPPWRALDLPLAGEAGATCPHTGRPLSTTPAPSCRLDH